VAVRFLMIQTQFITLRLAAQTIVYEFLVSAAEPPKVGLNKSDVHLIHRGNTVEIFVLLIRVF
jgi:hypothetical protein